MCVRLLNFRHNATHIHTHTRVDGPMAIGEFPARPPNGRRCDKHQFSPSMVLLRVDMSTFASSPYAPWPASYQITITKIRLSFHLGAIRKVSAQTRQCFSLCDCEWWCSHADGNPFHLQTITISRHSLLSDDERTSARIGQDLAQKLLPKMQWQKLVAIAVASCHRSGDT